MNRKFKVEDIVKYKLNTYPVPRFMLVLATGSLHIKGDLDYVLADLDLTKDLITHSERDPDEFYATYNTYLTAYLERHQSISKDRFVNLINKMPFYGIHWGSPEDYEYVTLKDLKITQILCNYNE